MGAIASDIKFLLVDDVEENLLALEGLLRRDDLDLLKANSGNEALELLLSNDFALAILDVQMPSMDGFELAELMRGSSRTRHIPIIFLTAGSFDDRRRFRGYEAGAVDFLFKPIEPNVLQGKAEVFTELYRQKRELMLQRDELREAISENNRLYQEILALNETLEARVVERTALLTEANEELKGFTHSVAHDFRQHIRNININAEIVLTELGDSAGSHKWNLERISQVAKSMNQMTDDLLNYARMRNTPIHSSGVNLSNLAREFEEASRAAYPNTEFVYEEDLLVCGDQTMLRVVLENLLDNAFKYSQKAVHPKVELGRDDEGFFVRDNGIGFDEAYAEKLFLPFERLVLPTQFVGTGMGLANVKRILQRHGGRVWANSEPGKGATFHFTVQAP